MLMNGGGITASSDIGTMSSSWSMVGTGDFNGDGKSDILWYEGASGTIKEWLMDGSTVTATPSVANGIPSSWSVIGTGDFNGDGKSDILLRNTNGTINEMLMNGSAITASYDIGTISSSWLTPSGLGS